MKYYFVGVDEKRRIDDTGWPCSSIFIFIFFINFFFLTTSLISFLEEVESDTFSLWNADCRLFAITNDHDVLETSGENVTISISDVGNFVRTWMLLKRLEGTNSTNVVSTCQENKGTVYKFDNRLDFVGDQVYLDWVVDINVGMWEPKGSCIVSDDIWDL